MVLKHKIHQYVKIKLTSATVYRCVLAGCSHYIRPEFILNKVGVCPYCGNEFLITRELARRKIVHCSSCTISKHKKVKPETTVSFLDEINELKENTK